jgi:hypothetical protein
VGKDYMRHYSHATAALFGGRVAEWPMVAKGLVLALFKLFVLPSLQAMAIHLMPSIIFPTSTITERTIPP